MSNSLGIALRGWRERVDLVAVGLVVTGRRRAPGLRREELAELADLRRAARRYPADQELADLIDDLIAASASFLAAVPVRKKQASLIFSASGARLAL